MTVEREAYIDRVVGGDRAVLIYPDNNQERILGIEELPEGAGEGSWLKVKELEDGGIVGIEINKEKEGKVRDKVSGLVERLKSRGGSKFKAR